MFLFLFSPLYNRPDMFTLVHKDNEPFAQFVSVCLRFFFYLHSFHLFFPDASSVEHFCSFSGFKECQDFVFEAVVENNLEGFISAALSCCLVELLTALKQRSSLFLLVQLSGDILWFTMMSLFPFPAFQSLPLTLNEL